MGKKTVSSRKKHKEKVNSVKIFCEKTMGIIGLLYLFAIFVIMPLYVYRHYYAMALIKWSIYYTATLVFMIGGMIVGLIYIGASLKKKCPLPKIAFNTTDILVMLYGASVLITMVTCGHPQMAWSGTDGWYMGALAQLLFAATFLIMSRVKISTSKVIWLCLSASTICYLIGIAQRYGHDIFHFYYSMPAEVIRDYLSTIGNRTWYSAYISVVFPLGLYLFWLGKSKKQTWLTGIYSFIAFSAIVTNNSDSIYLSLGAVFFALLVMSIGNSEKLCRWFYILALWFGSCGLMTLLRIFNADDVRILRGFSDFFLDIKTILIGLVTTTILILGLKYYMRKSKKPTECSPRLRKHIQIGCIISAALLAMLIVIVITLNTCGFFQNWFGFTINNKYLLFNDLWGDSRGFNWKFTIQMFCDLPFIQKLFGVGSDCYQFYAYTNPDYTETLMNFWGTGTVISNAHNEWLNALLCHGIVGSILYFSIFISVMVKCFRIGDSKNADPILIGVGLSLLGYMSHNLFCYQQICATGPIFILMGIAMQNSKKGI